MRQWWRRTWRRWHVWIAGVLILATTLVAYWPSFRSPFQFDDFNDLATPQFARQTPRQIIARYPTRWLAYVTLLANANLPRLQWRGWRPAGIVWYHIGNWVAHTTVAWLLYLFTLHLVYLFQRRRVASARAVPARAAALSSALLFALHPMLAQTVIYLSQRATLMMAVCYLSVLRNVVRALVARAGRWRAWVHAVVWLGVGAACKETIVSAPVAALWLWFLLRTPRARMRSWRRLFCGAGLFLLIVALPVITFLHLSRWHIPTILHNLRAIGGPLAAHTPGLTRATYLITQVTVIGYYLRLALWPSGLSIDHDVPLMSTVWQWPVVVWGAVLTGLGMIAWRWRRKVPLFAWGIGFFLIALLPQSSIMPTPDLMLEYRTYPALAGVTWMVLGLYGWLPLRPHVRVWRWLARGAIVLTLVIYSVLTWERSRIWRSDISLWYDAWRRAPYKQRVVNNLANALLRRNQSDLALALVQHTLSSTTSVLPHLVVTLGNIYAARGELAAATNAYLTALHHDWSNREARYNLGLLYAHMGLRASAIEQLRWLCHIVPDHADGWLLLGVLYSMSPEDKALATNAFARYLVLAPDGPEAAMAREVITRLTNAPGLLRK